MPSNKTISSFKTQKKFIKPPNLEVKKKLILVFYMTVQTLNLRTVPISFPHWQITEHWHSVSKEIINMNYVQFTLYMQTLICISKWKEAIMYLWNFSPQQFHYMLSSFSIWFIFILIHNKIIWASMMTWLCLEIFFLTCISMYVYIIS